MKKKEIIKKSNDYTKVINKNNKLKNKYYSLFYIKSDRGLIPAGITSDNTTIADCYRLGTTCTNWILANQNMDLLFLFPQLLNLQ